jgi:hypothetical protein
MGRRLLVLVGWTAGLVVVLGVLHGSGRGALAGPVLAEPGTWSDWAASGAVLRLVGIGLGWYLLTATTLGIAARLLGGARTVELADLVSVPLVRGVVQTGIGVGLAGSVLAAASAGTAVGARLPTAADVALATTETTAAPPADPTGTDINEGNTPESPVGRTVGHQRATT